MALSREFPEFYRYASIMEEASEAERRKASRPDDGMAEFSEDDLDALKKSLRTQGAEPKVLEYVSEAFGRLADRRTAVPLR